MSTKNAAQRPAVQKQNDKKSGNVVSRRQSKPKPVKRAEIKRLGNTVVIPYDDIEDPLTGEYCQSVPEVTLPIISPVSPVKSEPVVEIGEDLPNGMDSDLNEANSVMDGAIEAANLTEEEVRALFTMAGAIVKMGDALDNRGVSDGLEVIFTAVDLTLLKRDPTTPQDSEKPKPPIAPVKPNNVRRYLDMA